MTEIQWGWLYTETCIRTGACWIENTTPLGWYRRRLYMWEIYATYLVRPQRGGGGVREGLEWGSKIYSILWSLHVGGALHHNKRYLAIGHYFKPGEWGRSWAVHYAYLIKDTWLSAIISSQGGRAPLNTALDGTYSYYPIKANKLKDSLINLLLHFCAMFSNSSNTLRLERSSEYDLDRIYSIGSPKLWVPKILWHVTTTLLTACMDHVTHVWPHLYIHTLACLSSLGCYSHC